VRIVAHLETAVVWRTVVLPATHNQRPLLATFRPTAKGANWKWIIFLALALARRRKGANVEKARESLN